MLLFYFHCQLKYNDIIIHDLSPDSSALLSDKMNSEGPRTGQCWCVGAGCTFITPSDWFPRLCLLAAAAGAGVNISDLMSTTNESVKIKT